MAIFFFYHCSFLRRSLFTDRLFITKSVSVHSRIRTGYYNRIQRNPFENLSFWNLASWKLRHNFRDTTNMVIAFNGLSSTLNPSGLRTFAVFSSMVQVPRTIVKRWLFSNVSTHHWRQQEMIPFLCFCAMKIIERRIAKIHHSNQVQWLEMFKLISKRRSPRFILISADREDK